MPPGVHRFGIKELPRIMSVTAALETGIQHGSQQDGLGQPSYLPVKVPGWNVARVNTVVFEIVFGELPRARNGSTKRG